MYEFSKRGKNVVYQLTKLILVDCHIIFSAYESACSLNQGALDCKKASFAKSLSVCAYGGLLPAPYPILFISMAG